MKEQWSISKDKFVALEEALNCNGVSSSQRSPENNGTCKQLMQCLKLILYVELTLFIGWACYTMWQTYQTERMEVKVVDISRETQPQSIYNENAVLQASTVAPERFDEPERILQKVADILHEEFASSETHKNSREQTSSVIEPVVPSNRIETSDAERSWGRGPTLSEMSIDDERKELLSMPATNTVEIIEPADENLNISEPREESFESAQEEDDVLDCTFPLLWTIHGLREPNDFNRSELKERELPNVLDDEQPLADTPSIAESRASDQFASSETNHFDQVHNNPQEGISKSTEEIMDYDHRESNKALDWDVLADIVRQLRIESDANQNRENVENSWADQAIRYEPFLLTFQGSSDELISHELKSSPETDERETPSTLPSGFFTWSDIENDSRQSSISPSSDSYTDHGIPTSYPTETENGPIVTDSNEGLETTEDELDDLNDPKFEKFKVEIESHLSELIDSVFNPDNDGFSHRRMRSINSRQGSKE